MKTKVGILSTVLFSMFCLQAVNAQFMQLSRVQPNGTIIVQSIPENTTSLVLLLRQFTFIDVSFNPVCSNIQELKKLDRAGIKYRRETLK
ncbi:MAG TPA: hypothetical protein DCL73_12265 [Treponema sp.]|nr:hypothetical protein [Treponema sp.]